MRKVYQQTFSTIEHALDNIIEEAFRHSEDAEAKYREALEQLAAERQLSVSRLLDEYRLKAEALLANASASSPAKVPQSLPKLEQRALKAALAAVEGWQQLTDSVYLTIAADRGHAGRAHGGELDTVFY